MCGWICCEFIEVQTKPNQISKHFKTNFIIEYSQTNSNKFAVTGQIKPKEKLKPPSHPHALPTQSARTQETFGHESGNYSDPEELR
jgi:hypothetical protein